MATDKGFAKIDGHRCPLNRCEKIQKGQNQNMAELRHLAKIDTQRYTLDQHIQNRTHLSHRAKITTNQHQ